MRAIGSAVHSSSTWWRLATTIHQHSRDVAVPHQRLVIALASGHHHDLPHIRDFSSIWLFFTFTVVVGWRQSQAPLVDVDIASRVILQARDLASPVPREPATEIFDISFLMDEFLVSNKRGIWVA